MARNKKSSVDVGLGGILKGLGDLVEKLQELSEHGEQLSQSGEIRGAGEELKGIYGFTVRMGLGEQGPRVEPFGNLKRDVRSGRPVAEEVREPAVDVFEEDACVLVMAEMPGVALADVHLELDGDRLTITAETRDKKYRKQVKLPSRFIPEQMRANCNNGVLEVRLERR